MQTLTLENLTQKLKTAPQSVLERVAGYVDALLDDNKKSYSLTSEQQQILDSQINSDKSTYIKADDLYHHLKKKYEL